MSEYFDLALLAEAEIRLTPRIFTVSSAAELLHATLESQDFLQDIWVRGEVSAFTLAQSGHAYWTLKDSGAQLRCVCFRGQMRALSFRPSAGSGVIAHGRISFYEATGQCQLYVDEVLPDGAGALYQELERLREELEEQGLFGRKRPITRFPQRIGVVTSPTGAVIRDIINIAERRCRSVEIIVAPTNVQGAGACDGVCEAIRLLNQIDGLDVIVVARGGGSIEDLWTFNERDVAYAVFASAVPVVTAIGHETDWTIADYVADLRAPTPSAAAELLVPDASILLATVHEWVRQSTALVAQALDIKRADVEAELAIVEARSPRSTIDRRRQSVDELMLRGSGVVSSRMELARERTKGLGGRLGALSPASVLSRGFAMVLRENGEIVTSVGQVAPDDVVKVRVADGSFGARVQPSSYRGRSSAPPDGKAPASTETE